MQRNAMNGPDQISFHSKRVHAYPRRDRSQPGMSSGTSYFWRIVRGLIHGRDPAAVLELVRQFRTR
jgi:hypothetical protein